MRRWHSRVALWSAFCALSLGGLAPATAQDAAAPTATPAADTQSPAQLPPPPPLSAFGQLPSIETLDLSPDGNRLAAVTSSMGTRELVVLNRAGDKLRAIPLVDQKIRGVQWAGDDILIVYLSTTERLWAGTPKQEMGRAAVINLKPGGGLYWAFDDRFDMLGIVGGRYGIRQIGGRWYAYWGGYHSPSARAGGDFDNLEYSLYQVDLEADKIKRVALGDPGWDHRDWMLNEMGEIVATLDKDDDTGKWTIKNTNKTVIASGTALDYGIGMAGLSPDGTHLIYASFDEELDDYSYFEIALSDGSSRAQPTLPEEADSVLTRDTSPHIVAWRRDELGDLPVFFDEAANKNMRALQRALPNKQITISDFSDDLTMIVFQSHGRNDAGSWYQLDLAKRDAWLLDSNYPDVPESQIGEIQVIPYTAADGLAMEMIVTLPPELEPKNLPVIMFPHGGPHSHDEPVFDWWAQAMASRGYVVVQPNFRGSTNKDRAFMEAGYGEWGGKMQTDLSDALTHLAGLGMVDPNRACIVGASYGGYAALAGVTLQQGIYKCAVSVAGVSDLPLMRRDDLKTTNHEKSLSRYFDRAIGKGRDLKLLSPITFAERADAPVLLIHGKDDTVVYINQSERMHSRLKGAKKPVEYVILKGEDHWLSRGETRLSMLQSVVAFVEKHNPPGVQPTASAAAGP